MAKDVDPIIVKIQAEFNQFKKDLGEVKRGVKDFSTVSKDSNASAGASFDLLRSKTTAAVAAITALGVAAIALAKNASDNILTITRWSNRLGVAADEFSALALVARQFGAQTDDVGDAIKDLNERIADAARGNKTYEDAFKMVGLASKDLINLPVAEQFIKVADAIGKMNNVGDQNFATAELMADAGFRLLEVFRLGEDKIRGMTSAYKEQHLTVTKENIESAKTFDRAMVNLGMVSEKLGRQLLENIAEPLEKLSLWMIKVSNKMDELTGKDMRSNIEKAEDMRDAIVKTTFEYAKLIEHMNKWGGTQKDIDAINERFIKKLETMNTKLREFMGIQSESSGEVEAPKAPEATKNKDGKTEAEIFAENVALSYKMATESFQLYQLNDASLKAQAALEEINARQALMDQLNGIDKNAMEANQRMWEVGWKGKMHVMGDILGAMSVLMQSENRKMFEVGKAAAIAGTVISTIESAQKSFNSLSGIPIVGPALGAAAAAAAIAGGMARVQAIQSTTMGGGGGVGGSAGGAGGAGGAGATQAPTVQENVIDATFNVQGTSVSSDQLRGILGGINELVEDGARLRSVKMV